MSDHDLMVLIALVSGFIGTAMLWQFGLPKKNIDSEGATHIITEEKNKDEQKLWIKYDRLSHLGIVFLALSFGLQIIALWIE